MNALNSIFLNTIGEEVSKPPIGAETRWAGFLAMNKWVNEKKTGLMEYEQPDDCCENEDGTVFAQHKFLHYEWNECMQLVSCYVSNINWFSNACSHSSSCPCRMLF